MPPVPVKGDYLRIGELADRAGVSVATIKFYIREGLLPPAPVKTGRTMGYYDEAYLERLLLIRRLREEHFLPLRAIRLLLAERDERSLSPEESALIARIGPQVMQHLAESAPARDALERAAVRARYRLGDEELDLLVEMGLCGDADGQRFGPADLELLDALERLDRAGITRDRFPLEGIAHYVELLGELARREVRHFSHFATSANVPTDEVGRIAEHAVELTEPLVTLIRRRLILRALQAEIAKPGTGRGNP